MTHYLKIICYSGLFFIVAAAAWAAARDCSLGKAYYNQALQEQNLGRAGKLLQDSIKVCPSFHAWYQLGRILGETATAQETITAYEKAMTLADNPKHQAVALARIGQVMSRQSEDKTADAIIHLKNAAKLHPNPPAWMTVALQDLELCQSAMVTPADDIIHSLDVDATSNRAVFRSFKVKPSINLRVHFETDDHRLTPQSRQQVVELGKAMIAERFIDESFILIGHTDDRGNRKHNRILSEKRAATVYNELTRLYPELSGRLKTEGRGEDDLLYTGNTEKIHRLNRRLEVTFLSPAN